MHPRFLQRAPGMSVWSTTAWLSAVWQLSCAAFLTSAIFSSCCILLGSVSLPFVSVVLGWAHLGRRGSQPNPKELFWLKRHPPPSLLDGWFITCQINIRVGLLWWGEQCSVELFYCSLMLQFHLRMQHCADVIVQNADSWGFRICAM